MPNFSTQFNPQTRQPNVNALNALNANNINNNQPEAKNKYSKLENLIKPPKVFNQTKFALDTTPIMDSIISGSDGLIYTTASNTWELPNKFGLITHSSSVELKGNFFEETILTFFNQGQENISDNLPKLRWIRQVYAAVHDIGNIHRF